MFYNVKNVVSDSIRFHNSFVDLKVQGFKAFNKAFNELTYNFYLPLTSKLEEQVVDMGNVMKTFADKIKV